jgi:hypothetical protein
MHEYGEAVTSTCYVLVEIPEGKVPLGGFGLTLRLKEYGVRICTGFI